MAGSEDGIRRAPEALGEGIAQQRRTARGKGELPLCEASITEELGKRIRLGRLVQLQSASAPSRDRRSRGVASQTKDGRAAEPKGGESRRAQINCIAHLNPNQILTPTRRRKADMHSRRSREKKHKVHERHRSEEPEVEIEPHRSNASISHPAASQLHGEWGSAKRSGFAGGGPSQLQNNQLNSM